MLINYDRLHALALTDNYALAQYLASAFATHIPSSTLDVARPLRLQHFMAQVCFESGFFQRVMENLNYSPERIGVVWERLEPRAASLAHNPEALANAAYAGVNGNGDEASGDGWKYRGRGIIQITGKANYAKYSAITGPDPNTAAHPDEAVRVAIAFWEARNCNEAADRDSVRDVTARINPALEGLTERTFLTNRAKTIFT